MKIEKYFKDKKIILLQAGIADLETDAIVNAANDHLWMGSGVAGAIKAKGGDEIEKEVNVKRTDSNWRSNRYYCWKVKS